MARLLVPQDDGLYIPNVIENPHQQLNFQLIWFTWFYLFQLIFYLSTMIKSGEYVFGFFVQQSSERI